MSGNKTWSEKLTWHRQHVPNTVTLAHILSGSTCAPISLTDFEAYLAFKERSLENLHFVVWFQDYRKRFFELSQEHQAFSPGPQADEFRFSTPNRASIERRELESINQSASRHQSLAARPEDSTSPGDHANTVVQLVQDTTTDLKLQPLRDECMSVFATFLAPSAPKQLTLDVTVRDTVIRNVSINTHPFIFQPVYEEMYHLLETTSLPRFLQMAATNINDSKQIAFFCLGMFCLLAGVAGATALIITLPTPPEHNRAWRLLTLPLSSCGMTMMYCTIQGFCAIVWRRRAVQLRRWELHYPDLESNLFFQSIVTPQEQEKEPPRCSNSNSTDDITTNDHRADIEKAIAPFAYDIPPPPSSVNSHYTDQNTKVNNSRHDSRHTLTINTDIHNTLNTTIENRQYTRPPIFGPERVVQDPRILAVHSQIIWDVRRTGCFITLIFAAITFSIPGRK